MAIKALFLLWEEEEWEEEENRYLRKAKKNQ